MVVLMTHIRLRPAYAGLRRIICYTLAVRIMTLTIANKKSLAFALPSIPLRHPIYALVYHIKVTCQQHSNYLFYILTALSRVGSMRLTS